MVAGGGLRFSLVGSTFYLNIENCIDFGIQKTCIKLKKLVVNWEWTLLLKWYSVFLGLEAYFLHSLLLECATFMCTDCEISTIGLSTLSLHLGLWIVWICTTGHLPCKCLVSTPLNYLKILGPGYQLFFLLLRRGHLFLPFMYRSSWIIVCLSFLRWLGKKALHHCVNAPHYYFS